MPSSARILLVALLAALLCPSAVPAQYFGRNKVQYDDFAFRVVETPHFDVHVYERESEGLVVRLANLILTEAHRRGASDIHVEPSSSDSSARS